MKKSKIYTRTGDKGMTSLVGGQRVEKTNVRLEAYGTVDELNAHLGLLDAHLATEKEKRYLHLIQNQLFVLGAYLATDFSKELSFNVQKITPKMIEFLEKAIDEMNLEVPEVRAFILPKGTVAAATCHVCRTVCRKAERRMLALHEINPLETEALSYINRLSDFLFILSRKINFLAHNDDFFWDKTCE
jgi:cob(I)alamin adenosyltransferase